jgi:hypothetical protein
MPPSDLLALARTIAARHKLDPALVCAVIEQESSWDTHAIRYESAFRSRYVAPQRYSESSHRHPVEQREPYEPNN